MGEQKNLNLPYLIVANGDKYNLLVSAPDGKVLEFSITPDIAEGLDDALKQSDLWDIFFKTLIAAKWVDEN